MDTRRRIVIGVLIAAVCVITMSAAYIRIAPEGGRVAGEEVIGVVVTILPQADFVENVGGDKVRVTVMVPPGASPHTYEPTPGQLREVSKAKVYFKVGSGVEFEQVWMDKIMGVNPNMLIVDCAKGITMMGNDPHIWNSPVNARVIVENICDGLTELDPGCEAYYTANRDKYLQELDDVDAYIHERLDRFTKNRIFMTYHPAFGYFAEEYNLTQIAIEHKGKAPTPKVIQDCVDKARQYNLSYIYVAPQFATKDAEAIAQEIGGQIVFIDPLPRDYIANMRSIAASLSLEME
ncbi:MAG: zinc ABC transporter substrate-binding protein [archaeon]|nr:zinc ABC transporter substrate-binding protein [archaeon]